MSMIFTVKWFGDKFNVGIEKDGEEVMSVKGCAIRFTAGGDEFLSMPSTKNQSTGKYWNHAWASDKLAKHIISLAQKSKPEEKTQKKDSGSIQDMEDDIPF